MRMQANEETVNRNCPKRIGMAVEEVMVLNPVGSTHQLHELQGTPKKTTVAIPNREYLRIWGNRGPRVLTGEVIVNERKKRFECIEADCEVEFRCQDVCWQVLHSRCSWCCVNHPEVQATHRNLRGEGKGASSTRTTLTPREQTRRSPSLGGSKFS